MQPGDVIVRREVWHGQPWSALAGRVICDEPGLLAVHIPIGSPFGFAASHPLGVHSWSRNDAWQNFDVVMLHRPDDAYSVWFFGAVGVYVNLQDPIRRTTIGFDTFDHELDIVVSPDGTWALKDEERLPLAVETGRFTEAEVDAIWATAAVVTDQLDRGAPWWDEAWSRWCAPSEWPTPELPADWLHC